MTERQTDAPGVSVGSLVVIVLIVVVLGNAGLSRSSDALNHLYEDNCVSSRWRRTWLILCTAFPSPLRGL